MIPRRYENNFRGFGRVDTTETRRTRSLEGGEKSQLNGQATFTTAEVPLFRSGAIRWNDIPAIFLPLALPLRFYLH